MGIRKRRRTRSDDGGHRADLSHGVTLGPFAPEHHPYTIEGRLEMLQAFLDGVRRARGTKRIAGLTLVLVFLIPLVVGLLVEVATLLR